MSTVSHSPLAFPRTEREGSTISEFYTVIRDNQKNADPQVSCTALLRGTRLQ